MLIENFWPEITLYVIDILIHIYIEYTHCTYFSATSSIASFTKKQNIALLILGLVLLIVILFRSQLPNRIPAFRWKRQGKGL